ncbi:CaiB/BaiF CoA-transferase family protein [uncultured Nocardioides sp.]|uniref:CaiB/BaiF CoA transferase family protein n=1 Tax=uncultured Nocardioides sp. TaxID=198441 RepID=UPI00260F4A16|nr:CaiB/BaiF CoA-transferase family protein [uncultured Nocardioides sp.]
MVESTDPPRTGPLQGVKVVEIAGIGPGPHACTILADLGADVVRLERPQGGAVSSGPTDLLTRGRPSVGIDLKHPEAAGLVLDLVAGADVLVEGMRPGTTERLGIGPDACWERNPALVYGRMTGWGQDGPLAPYAGHDMNYVALTGALHGLGQDPDRPHFPMNLLGDFGGGSTYLVIGILAALLESKVSGRGQVVDAAITDGTAHLNAMTMGFLAGGGHVERRASNFLDGGQPYYDLYATADGRHMSVGPLEPKFYDEFCRLLGITDDAPDRWDPARADELRRLVAGRFAQRTMADWTAVFEHTDACVAPVLTMAEAAEHPHNVARGTLVERDGILQPGPAPRFSRTAPELTTGPSSPGSGTRDALAAWGVADLDGLLERGVVTQT